jgi:hypothetical protein
MTAKLGRMLQNQDSHLSALLQIYIHRGNQSFIGLYTGGLVPPWKAKSANMKEKRQPSSAVTYVPVGVISDRAWQA